MKISVLPAGVALDGADLLPMAQAGTTRKVTLQNLSDAIVAEVSVSNGLPTGGTTGQVLGKATATDFDVSWQTPAAGGGGGGGGVSGAGWLAAPVAPHAYNEEFNSTSINAAWAFIVPSGTVVNATTTPSTYVASANNWNANADVISGLVLRPITNMQMHRPFAPGSGSSWCVVCRMSMAGTGNDTGAYMHVSLSAPTTELYTNDCITLGIRRNSSEFWQARTFGFSGGSYFGDGISDISSGTICLALVGLPSNAIESWISVDGILWTRLGLWTGLAVNGNVNSFSFFIGGATAAIDFVRFSVISSDFRALGGVPSFQ